MTHSIAATTSPRTMPCGVLWIRNAVVSEYGERYYATVCVRPSVIVWHSPLTGELHPRCADHTDAQEAAERGWEVPS